MRRLALCCAILVGASTACRRRDRSPALPKEASGPTVPIVVECTDQGCPADAAGRPLDGGQLTVHVEAEPAVLCDLVEHDAWSRWIVENQVAETLFYQDPWSGKLQPRLAERWEGDAKRLTVHLRAGVTWHDGQPFTARDVAFTLEKARDPKIGSDWRADLEPITMVKQLDDRTLVLELGRPAPYLRQALAHVSILPAHAYEGRDLRTAPASRAPIGTGPFRFVKWTPGQEIVIARNEGYWGERAHLDRVVFKIVRDKQVAWQLYQRGEIDVLWQLPSARVAEEARTDSKLAGHRMLRWAPRAYFFVVWNTQKFPDARVRRALTMLIDRERLRQIAFAGRARPTTGPYAPGTPSYDGAVTPWPYDPAQAKKLLAEAGVKDLSLTFLLTAGSRTVEQLATLMKEDFARAGVRLEVQTVDFAVLLDRLRKHDFDASSLRWTLSLEQDNYDMFHSSQAAGGQNYGAYRSAAADALLEQIRATVDDDARHALDRKLHRLLHDEQPYTFLSVPEAQTLEAPRVHGLSPSIDGFSFQRAWVQ